MAVVAVAIVLSFHLKTRPSDAELRMAKPLGLVFWGLSVACLLVGLGNYIREFPPLSLDYASPCFLLYFLLYFLLSRGGGAEWTTLTCWCFLGRNGE